MKYNYGDLMKKRKLLTLLFSLENAKGEEFNDAVRYMRFSKLNHYLLNTDIGKEHFPGMTLKNLEHMYFEVNKISPYDPSIYCPYCYKKIKPLR